jgi:hypothetical protein
MVVENIHDAVTFVRLYVKNWLLPEEVENAVKEVVLFGSTKVEPVSDAVQPHHVHHKQSFAKMSRFSRKNDMMSQSFRGSDELNAAASGVVAAVNSLGAISELTADTCGEDRKRMSSGSLIGENKVADEKDELANTAKDSVQAVAPSHPSKHLSSNPRSGSPTPGANASGKLFTFSAKNRTLSFDSQSSDDSPRQPEPRQPEPTKADSSRALANTLHPSVHNHSPTSNPRQTFSLRSPSMPKGSNSRLRTNTSDDDASPPSKELSSRKNSNVSNPGGLRAPSLRSMNSQRSALSGVTPPPQLSSRSSSGSGVDKLVVERKASITQDTSVAFVCDKKEVLLHKGGAPPGRRKSVMGSGTAAVHVTHPSDVDAAAVPVDPSAIKNHSIIEAYIAHKKQNLGARGKDNVKVTPESATEEIVKEDFSDIFFFKDPKHFYRSVCWFSYDGHRFADCHACCIGVSSWPSCLTVCICPFGQPIT